MAAFRCIGAARPTLRSLDSTTTHLPNKLRTPPARAYEEFHPPQILIPTDINDVFFINLFTIRQVLIDFLMISQ